MIKKLVIIMAIIPLGYPYLCYGLFVNPTQEPGVLPPTNLNCLNSENSIPASSYSGPELYLNSDSDVPEADSITDALDKALDKYIFGESREDLSGEDKKIYDWEVKRWQSLIERGKTVDEVLHMINLRAELKPLVEPYHYFVEPERKSLRDWKLYSDTMERMVSMIEGEYAFVQAGARIEEIGYKMSSPIAKHEGTEWSLNYDVSDVGNFLDISIIDEASDFTKFDTIRFYVKGDTDKFRLGFRYLDEEGVLRDLPMGGEGVRVTDLVDEVEVKKDKWSLVEVSVDKLREMFPEADWSKITTFRVLFNPHDFGLLESDTGTLYLKDIYFQTPEAGKDRTLDEVKDIIKERSSTKDKLQNKIGRPLILNTLEDRMMVETGKINQWQSDDSMLAFLNVYHGGFFNPDRLPIDESTIEKYKNLKQKIGLQKVKEKVSIAIVLRPFVENLIGNLVRARAEDEGILTGIVEGMTEDIQGQSSGGFMWWRDLWNGISNLFGAGMTQMDVIREVAQELSFASKLRNPVEEALLQRSLDMDAPGGKDIGFLLGYAAEVRNRLGGVDDVTDSVLALQQAKIEGDVEKVKEIKKKFSEQLDKVENKIKYYGRLLGVYTKHFGYRLDPVHQKGAWLGFQNEFAVERRLLTEEKQVGTLRTSWPTKDQIEKSQDRSVEHRYPVSYLVPSNKVPVKKIDGRKAIDLNYNAGDYIRLLSLELGDFQPANFLNLMFKISPGQENTPFKMIIQNKNGEKAVYRISGISSEDWTDLWIPLRAPLQVDWVDSDDPEFLSNQAWKEWITSAYLWKSQGDGTYKLRDDISGLLPEGAKIVLESDNISDWRNIESISFKFPKGKGSLYVSGRIYEPGENFGKIDLNSDMDILSNYLQEGSLLAKSTTDPRLKFVFLEINSDIITEDNIVYINPHKCWRTDTPLLRRTGFISRNGAGVGIMNISDFIKKFGSEFELIRLNPFETELRKFYHRL